MHLIKEMKGVIVLYKYISSIHIHFTTVTEPFIIMGKEAQFLYDSDKIYLDTSSIHVNMDHSIRIIPRNNILYVDIVENTEANQIYAQINHKFEVIQTLTHIRNYHWRSWCVKNGECYVKSNSGKYTKVSSDPKVSQLVKEIHKLDDQLKLSLEGK